MKIYIFLLLLIPFITTDNYQQYLTLEEIDYKSYCNKELSILMENDTIKNYKDYYFIDEPPFVLSYVVFVYENDKTLEVYFKELKFQKTMNPRINWSLDLLMKEKFGKVDVYLKEDSLLTTCKCKI